VSSLCKPRRGDWIAIFVLVGLAVLVFALPSLLGKPVLPGDDMTQNYPLRVLAGQQITFEDVLSATAITYPETYVQDMTGEQLKAVLEDVADNLFNPDPYYQQGGDMVRVGGMDYACAPNESAGNRISGMRLNDGTAVEAGKIYRVAGWASVNPQQGYPVSAVAADYLKAAKTVKLKRPNHVALNGVDGNPGIAEAE